MLLLLWAQKIAVLTCHCPTQHCCCLAPSCAVSHLCFVIVGWLSIVSGVLFFLLNDIAATVPWSKKYIFNSML